MIQCRGEGAGKEERLTSAECRRGGEEAEEDPLNIDPLLPLPLSIQDEDELAAPHGGRRPRLRHPHQHR